MDKKSIPCLWRDEEECNTCELSGKLHCHLDKSHALIFGTPFIAYMIPTIIGLIFLPLPANIVGISVWIGYLVFFFLWWEPRILCSHCPFYAEPNTQTLHCSINYGFRKTTTYNPEPATNWEQAQFIIGVILIFGIPSIFLIFDNQWIILLIGLGAIVWWVIVLQKYICTDCINFSCVLNKVPEDLKKKFIGKNPCMRDG